MDNEIQEEIGNNEPYKDPKTGKWKNYHAKKGVEPPWKPFSDKTHKSQAKRMTMNERKFLWTYSETGNLSQAYRTTYKVKAREDKKAENAYVYTMASQVLRRLRAKFPDMVKTMTYEEVTPENLQSKIMAIHDSPGSTNTEKLKSLEMVGRIFGKFTEKNIVVEKVKEIRKVLYNESENDMPEHKDDRKARPEIEIPIV